MANSVKKTLFVLSSLFFANGCFAEGIHDEVRQRGTELLIYNSAGCLAWVVVGERYGFTSQSEQQVADIYQIARQLTVEIFDGNHEAFVRHPMFISGWEDALDVLSETSNVASLFPDALVNCIVANDITMQLFFPK